MSGGPPQSTAQGCRAQFIRCEGLSVPSEDASAPCKGGKNPKSPTSEGREQSPDLLFKLDHY